MAPESQDPEDQYGEGRTPKKLLLEIEKWVLGVHKP